MAVMSRTTELMYKAVSVVEAATGRNRQALELEFLDDHVAFYRKYEEHLRKLPDADRKALQGSR
jgi:hypothetical protein